MPCTRASREISAGRCVLRDCSAGVALMFALTVIPVIGVIGIAIDLGFVTQARTQLNSAADAAALASAKGAADAFTAGQQDYIAIGQAAGQQWFYSHASSVFGAALQTPSVKVTQSGAVFASTVTYQGAVTPYFAPIFGINTISLGGLSSATITTNAYVSVTFLLDNSSSMLIAATQLGVDTMNAITPSFYLNYPVEPRGLGGLPCAFACHWDSGGNDYYGLARSRGITLRFDVLKSAVFSAIGKMKSQQLIAEQFSVAIYTFADALTEIYQKSTNLDGGADAARRITTPVVIDAANTNFPKVMMELFAASSAAGDGSSTAKPKKALIIVTDGLVDYGIRSTPTSKGPINPANCTAMKNLGYNVYVLYTTYITTPANLLLPFDNIDLLPYIKGTASPTMANSLQSCASAPTNYAEASDPAAIDTAMTQMLQAALGNGGRFTN